MKVVYFKTLGTVAAQTVNWLQADSFKLIFSSLSFSQEPLQLCSLDACLVLISSDTNAANN